MSPALAGELAVEYGECHELGYALGAVHEDGILVEERGPVMGLAWVGRLVGYQAHGDALPGAAQPDELTGGVVLAHIVAPEACADVAE